MKIINNKKATLAITQIFILIVGIIAMSYAIGSSVGVVNADGGSYGYPPPLTQDAFGTNAYDPFKLKSSAFKLETPSTFIPPFTIPNPVDIRRTETVDIDLWFNALAAGADAVQLRYQDHNLPTEYPMVQPPRPDVPIYYDTEDDLWVQPDILVEDILNPTYAYYDPTDPAWQPKIETSPEQGDSLITSQYFFADQDPYENYRLDEFGDLEIPEDYIPSGGDSPMTQEAFYAEKDKYQNFRFNEEFTLNNYENFVPSIVDEKAEDYVIPKAIVDDADIIEEAVEAGEAVQNPGRPIVFNEDEMGEIVGVDKDGNLVGDLNLEKIEAVGGIEIEKLPEIPEKTSLLKGIGAVAGVIFKSAGAALGVYTMVQTMGAVLFPDDKEEVDAASLALSAGTFTYSTLKGLFGKGGLWQIGEKGISTGWATGIGLAVAVGVFLYTYKKTNEEVVIFECMPWEAPTGGSKCEECNKQGELPCSEYQCRSLGQSCQIVNIGTEEEQCVWVNRNDIKPPIIQAWDDALINSEYKYVEDQAISPPDRGVKILYLPKNH